MRGIDRYALRVALVMVAVATVVAIGSVRESQSGYSRECATWDAAVGDWGREAPCRDIDAELDSAWREHR